MILKLLNNHIRRAFSNSAIHYEVLASMQYEIGRELIKKMGWNEDCQTILDVGMGTGKLTNRLSHLCPGSQVIGIDFADGMIDEARKKYETFKIVQADAITLPFYAESFDAVISNLAYQWVEDLPASFSEVRRVLKNNGKFCATMFGQETFSELFESLENVASKKDKKLLRLNSMSKIRASLIQAGFKDIEVTSEVSKTHFDDLPSLLQWLKGIGANVMNRDFYIGPQHLKKATEYYQDNFSGRWGIVASFEVIWLKGKK